MIKHFLDKSNVNVGANIVILGFPMGIRDEKHYQPIARRGIISRNDSTQFIGDVLIFPGNSGGPVFYVPVLKLGKLLSSELINSEKLIGVESITYIDYAISSQTKWVRVVFEDNSGLCTIIPINEVSKILNRQDFIDVENKLIK